MAGQLVNYRGQLHAFPADFTEKDIAAALAQVDNTETQKSLAKDMAGPPSFRQLASEVASRTPEMLVRVAKNLVMAPIGMAKEAASAAMEGAPGGVGGMLGNVAKRMVIDPAIDQGKKAIENVKQGRYSEAFGHGGAALIPMLGPAAANIGEKIGTGDPEQMSQGVADAATMAVAPSAMRLTGRVVSGLGNAMKSSGVSTELRALKIPESAAKKTSTYRTTGDLAGAEQEIAQTLLSRNAGAITRKNVKSMRGRKAASSKAVGDAVDQMEPVPSTPVLRAMANEVRQMKREIDPGADAAMSRYRTVRDKWTEQVPEVVPAGEVSRMEWPKNDGYRQAVTGNARERALWEAKQAEDPSIGTYQPIRVRMRGQARQLSARELQDFDVAAGKRNAAKYAQRDTVAPAVSRVDMAGSQAGRAVMNKRSDALREANSEFAAVRPALDALSKAKQRIGHHDPISLTQAGIGGVGSGIGFLAGGPIGAATVPAVMGLLSFLQRGGPLSRIAQALYNTGGKAQGAGAVLSQADMAALVAQLQQQAQPEQ